MKKMSGLKWCLLVFVVLVIVQILINPHILRVPYIHAEDGAVFIDDYQRFGISSLFMKFNGGYLVTVSRIFAILAVTVGEITNSVLKMAHALNYLAIGFTALVGMYFASDSFTFLVKSRKSRLIIATLVIILSSNFLSAMYNGVGIHWWCGLVVVLASFQLLNKQLPPKWAMPLILLAVISSASVVVLAFAMIYYVWALSKRTIHKDKRCVRDIWGKILDGVKCLFTKIPRDDLIRYVLLGVFLVIQIVVMVFVKTQAPNIVHAEFSFNWLVGMIYNCFNITLASTAYIFGGEVFTSLMANHLGVLVGGIIWSTLFYFAKKYNYLKYCVLALIDVAFIYFMIFFKQENPELFYRTILVTPIYYSLLAAMVCFIIIAVIFAKHLSMNRLLKTSGALLVVLCGVLLYQSRNMSLPTQRNLHLDYIESFVDYGSNYYTTVKISPLNEDWVMLVPVDSDRYCKEVDGCVTGTTEQVLEADNKRRAQEEEKRLRELEILNEPMDLEEK